MSRFYSEKIYLPEKLPVTIALDLDEKNAFKNPLHYHDFFEFFIVKSGNCIHHINGNSIVIGANKMVLIRPDDRHNLTSAKNSGFTYHNINIKADAVLKTAEFMGVKKRFESIKKARHLSPITLTNVQEKYITDICRNIESMANVDTELACMYSQILITIFITYALCTDNSSEGKQPPAWLIKLLSDMQKEENYIFGISVMTELCSKSSSQIYRAIKKHLGITPTEFVNQNRLEKARQQLITSQKSVTDIAYDVGFDNMSHFYHLFKKNFGTTPQSMREQNIIND